MNWNYVKHVFLPENVFVRIAEIHLSKEEIVERLSNLTEEGLYEGEFSKNSFYLVPKQRLFSFKQHFEAKIIGEFGNEIIPIELKITLKRSNFQLLFTGIILMMLSLSLLLVLISDMDFKNKWIISFLMFMFYIGIQHVFSEHVRKAEIIFYQYLKILFKPLEFRIK